MSEKERIHMKTEHGVRCRLYRGENLVCTDEWMGVTCKACLRHAPARVEMDPKKRTLEWNADRAAKEFCDYAVKVCRNPGQVQEDLANLLEEANRAGREDAAKVLCREAEYADKVSRATNNKTIAHEAFLQSELAKSWVEKIRALPAHKPQEETNDE